VNLADIDLNLLVVLDVLLDEAHIGRAAQRLNMTQAVLNSSLNRLRRAVGDPLLVRAHGKLVHTARAQEMRGPLREVLAQIQQVIEPPLQFDPRTSRNTFTLCVTDYAEFVLLPKLVQRLNELAPGVRVAVRHMGDDFPESELESGRIDLVLGHFEVIPPLLQHQPLFTERLVCVVRNRHPKVKEKEALPPTSFTALSHVSVAPRGGCLGLIDDILAQSGLERRIALRVPSFLVAPMVVAQTDLIVTLPGRVADHFSKLLPLKVLEPPIPLGGYPLVQVWSERAEATAQQWLRNVVAKVGEQIGDPNHDFDEFKPEPDTEAESNSKSKSNSKSNSKSESESESEDEHEIDLDSDSDSELDSDSDSDPDSDSEDDAESDRDGVIDESEDEESS
jgi:DNA-binding transcriptional LysR family regulator